MPVDLSKRHRPREFHPGKEWKRLTEQAMEIVRTKDTGTLQYEIFFNADESEAIVFERYRDADAAIEHFTNIGHLMEPIMATATSPVRCWGRRTPR
jgi:quinol monooxygenase YgiN